MPLLTFTDHHQSQLLSRLLTEKVLSKETTGMMETDWTKVMAWMSGCGVLEDCVCLRVQARTGCCARVLCQYLELCAGLMSLGM